MSYTSFDIYEHGKLSQIIFLNVGINIDAQFPDGHYTDLTTSEPSAFYGIEKGKYEKKMELMVLRLNS
uniref:Uncharacterized protein n=1 Tax=Acrobeloides nanus TaxID=290746 RepID=A0A914CNG1_9BILA